MRSTRRAEDAVGWVGVVALVGGAALVSRFLPPVPDHPLFEGAGHTSPVRGGTLVAYHEDDMRSLDPARAYDEISGMGVKLVFETLLDYDPALHFVPRLAARLPEASTDGRTFTFELRDDVRFSNGRALVAEDVRWSLERMLASDTGSPGASFYEALEGYEAFREGHAPHVAGIEVLGPHTVRFRLQVPDRTFLNALALTFAAPVPREEVERLGEEFARHPVGPGAFRLESWEPALRATFVRNETFFIEGQPYLDRIVLELSMERGTAFMRFQAGDIAQAHRFSPNDNLWLHRQDAWRPYVVDTPLLDVWGLGMNCELEPFDDVHVRRAVAFAVDGTSWRRARGGRLLLNGQPIPAAIAGHDDALPGAHHLDLDAAREEMRLAGHPVEREGERWVARGLEAPIEVWVGSGSVGRAYGELIQHDLAAIGLTIQIREVAFPTYLAETGRRRTVRLFLTGWNADYPNAASVLTPLFHSRSIHESGSENRSFYANPELDALLDRARVEPDATRQAALYREASAILVHDAPWAFVFSNLVTDAWQPYVRDYAVHPVWRPFYRDVWLDLPRHAATVPEESR